MAHRHDDHDHEGHGHVHTPAHGAHSHHGHHHAPVDFGRAFMLGVALNAAFVVIETIFGFASNSMALLADAGHNLSDALGLGVAWFATILAKRRPSNRFTYGLGGSSILAALFNGAFLLAVTGGLTWEAAQRFYNPQPVAGKTVMIIAACGIALNGFCAWLFSKGGKDELNVRGAYMHMAADALVSLAVVLSGLIILVTGWRWVDPVMSLIVNAVIVWGTWSLLTGSIAMALGAVPATVDLPKVRQFLLDLPGVSGLHDLHIWSLSTTEVALTCHLVVPSGQPADSLLFQAADELKKRFAISHVTIQPEQAPTAEHLAAMHNQ